MHIALWCDCSSFQWGYAESRDMSRCCEVSGIKVLGPTGQWYPEKAWFSWYFKFLFKTTSYSRKTTIETKAYSIDDGLESHRHCMGMFLGSLWAWHITSTGQGGKKTSKAVTSLQPSRRYFFQAWAEILHCSLDGSCKGPFIVIDSHDRSCINDLKG